MSLKCMKTSEAIKPYQEISFNQWYHISKIRVHCNQFMLKYNTRNALIRDNYTTNHEEQPHKCEISQITPLLKLIITLRERNHITINSGKHSVTHKHEVNPSLSK